MSAQGPSSPPAATLDPPFRGYIETTFDALLVFEAARRGMIPRVTRRLIERERSMVQSGAVFVFDEHESGIKRWTDGLIWSPSRILGNFLVYRQTDKAAGTKPSTPVIGSGSPNGSSEASPPRNRSSHGLPNQEAGPSRQDIGISTPLGLGQLHRPRSTSDGGNVDRARERQLVGSLTNSYKFTSGGLVKKTMSVVVNDYAQHMISYYTMEDALAGRLRTPSSIPELAALEIAPEYLIGQSFRFPPRIEYGPDGKPRYRGEPDLPQSPQSPTNTIPPAGYPADYYDYNQPQHLRMEPSQSQRSISIPVPAPIHPGPAPTYMTSPNPQYYDHPAQMHHSRQDSGSSSHGHNSPSLSMRPGSSSRRYDPYGGVPRVSSVGSLQMAPTQFGSRRQSQPQPIPVSHDEYYGQQGYDVKPNINGGSFSYQPPSTAPSSFAQYYPSQNSPVISHPPPTPNVTSSYHPGPQQYAAAWNVAPTAPTSRLIPTGPAGLGHQLPNPPSSSGSSGSGGVTESWANHVSPGGGPAVWEAPGTLQAYHPGLIPHAEEWRESS